MMIHPYVAELEANRTQMPGYSHDGHVQQQRTVGDGVEETDTRVRPKIQLCIYKAAGAISVGSNGIDLDSLNQP